MSLAAGENSSLIEQACYWLAGTVEVRPTSNCRTRPAPTTRIGRRQVESHFGGRAHVCDKESHYGPATHGKMIARGAPVEVKPAGPSPQSFRSAAT